MLDHNRHVPIHDPRCAVADGGGRSVAGLVEQTSEVERVIRAGKQRSQSATRQRYKPITISRSQHPNGSFWLESDDAYCLRMLLILVAFVAFLHPLYFSTYDPRTDSLVGTWRASVRTEIDGEPAAAVPILWRLNADGTAQYGRIPGDAQMENGDWFADKAISGSCGHSCRPGRHPDFPSRRPRPVHANLRRRRKWQRTNDTQRASSGRVGFSPRRGVAMFRFTSRDVLWLMLCPAIWRAVG